MKKEEIFDIEKACEAQRKFVKEHDYPHFAPGNGICYNCRRNIYGQNGYSVERASLILITGCPFCCYSYCE
jgi:hypothetical protein